MENKCKLYEEIPRLTQEFLSSMNCSQLVDFLIAETFEEAVFSMISAITAFNIESREEASKIMERDEDARYWGEITALSIPEPYEYNREIVEKLGQ